MSVERPARPRGALPVVGGTDPVDPPVVVPPDVTTAPEEEDEDIDFEALVDERVTAALAEQEAAIQAKIDEAVRSALAGVETQTKSAIETAIAQQAAAVASPNDNPLTPVAGTIVTSMPEVRRKTSAPNKRTGTITEHFSGGEGHESNLVEVRPHVIDEGDDDTDE